MDPFGQVYQSAAPGQRAAAKATGDLDQPVPCPSKPAWLRCQFRRYPLETTHASAQIHSQTRGGTARRRALCRRRRCQNGRRSASDLEPACRTEPTDLARAIRVEEGHRDHRADEGQRLRGDWRRRERRRAGGHRRHRRGQRRGRPLPHLPGRGPGRRQDLRHALRGPTPARAGRRRRRRVRRELRAAAHRGADQRPGGHPPQGGRLPGKAPGGDGPRRGAPKTARGRPGRRAGSHERAGVRAARETLAGCAGHPRRGHQRHHHRQHPAPGEPRRCGRADDRGEGPRTGTGLGACAKPTRSS